MEAEASVFLLVSVLDFAIANRQHLPKLLGFRQVVKASTC